MGLSRAAWLERRFGAAVQWLPFDLHPEYPPGGIPREALERRYGPGRTEHTRRMIVEAGLEYAPSRVVSNSMRALQLAEFAREAGGMEALHPLLFRSYWAEGRDIGDLDVLLDVAARAGIDVDGAARALGEDRYRDLVRGSTEVALRAGIDGVPAWVVEERYLIPGAQPPPVFGSALERLGFAPVGNET